MTKGTFFRAGTQAAKTPGAVIPGSAAARQPGAPVEFAAVLEDFCERAGILEYEGGEERTQAGKRALRMMEAKYCIYRRR